MAAPLQPFESSWQKDIERKQLKEARERYLEKAKADYERREKKKEDAKQRGEGTWMLPCVADRVDKDEQAVKKRKLKKEKSEKKKKKQKKEKSKSKKAKKKRKKKHKDSDDSSSDSSDSDSDSEMEWAEKSEAPAPAPAPAAIGPKIERQDWMVDPLADIFGGVTREQIREQKKKESGVEEEKPSVIDQLGQHQNELNPYWKDGGSGMPEEDPCKKKSKKAVGSVAGDGGLSWWRKAYQRCVEAAKEEGRTLEDVAADRYGSLKKLEKMLAEAEKRNSKTDDNRSSRNWGRDREPGRERDRYSDRDNRRSGGGMSSRFMKPGESGSSSTDRGKMFMKPGEEKKKFSFMKPGEESDSRTAASSSSSSSSSGWRKAGHQDSDSVPRWKKAQSTQSQESRDRERDSRRDRDTERSRDRSRDRRRGRSRSSSRGRDKSNSRDRRNRSRSRDRQRDSSKERHDDRRRDRSRSRDRQRDRSQSRDRQRDSSKERHDDRRRERSRSKDRGSHGRSAERSESKDRQRRRSPSSSSDSSSDSESEAESSEPQSESEPEPEPVRVLTEDEMNALGAKILRAEMMGNEEMVTKLKAELEEARKVKASARAAAAANPTRPATKGKEEDSVVVLTRTDRHGNVRPLPAGKHEGGGGGGRRKKEKVSTHSKGGERERYFADDDKHDLKELVKREKMNTAEDANLMFARLAGRSIEKTDDEYQLDDVMVNRANKQMSDAKTEERDRGAAIYEHRKMQSTIEKCQFCFENIPKHLIIAIGLKVILCLPAHRSMVPGHCLIVPMQHTISGTAVDDDVWTEVQVFRKGLTAMFKEQGEDVVFMETSMHLRHYPHMVVEVIPMPSETGEMAPIYFKKAIQESDTEWAQNKKLIDLSKKNVRQSVPKGFPYFAVDFGLQGGFAHVIEDEQIFPSYFGREICGGMMDVEPNLWRKPHKEDFERQRQKVLKFAEWWKPYDWTQKLKADNESDSN